jgi:hypothetical protein
MLDDDNRSKTMSRSLAILIVCTVVGVTISSAHAGPCAEDIAQVREAARRSATNPAAGPSAAQSVGAQLGRQPTPESVKRGEEDAQSRFAAILARADALDAEGRYADCMQAVSDAKRVLELD